MGAATGGEGGAKGEGTRSAGAVWFICIILED
jgi:hypothetical protein